MNEKTQYEKEQRIIESTQDLLIAGSANIYIPQIACRYLNICFKDCEKNSKSICLKGPENQYYWEAWGDVLNYGTIDGKALHQDGALWLIDYDKRSELIEKQGKHSEYIKSLIEGILDY